MTTQAPRACAHCAGPIPATRNARAIYCHKNCSRKATYHRKSPQERSVINKRSNDYRFEKRLLPIIRGMQIDKLPPEITPGSPLATWMVCRILLESLAKWQWTIAINYASVRETLAHLAGGHDRLLQCEDILADAVAQAFDRLEAVHHQDDEG